VNECPICRREVPEAYLEKHHLVPRAKQGKDTVFLCCDCGDQLHKLFTNKELEKELNELAKLLANEKVRKWVKWIRKQKSFGFCMKSKKRK